MDKIETDQQLAVLTLVRELIFASHAEDSMQHVGQDSLEIVQERIERELVRRHNSLKNQ